MTRNRQVLRSVEYFFTVAYLLIYLRKLNSPCPEIHRNQVYYRIWKACKVYCHKILIQCIDNFSVNIFFRIAKLLTIITSCISTNFCFKWLSRISTTANVHYTVKALKRYIIIHSNYLSILTFLSRNPYISLWWKRETNEQQKRNDDIC